ncbi:TetR family transcriptional regulator [Verticiella sediminum]|uniref:TetR family transcriptional regulator n=1 Tax=Verticiella sediminum TaxID=1247510 RepID=A0A556AGU7_9BURK|nr:TetR family transcriptional regulator C-terminal domain-containing protein [Verticiella sediminum]TSH92114.1 TetR family transcriptional regulator [Verticiella sediminum]
MPLDTPAQRRTATRKRPGRERIMHAIRAAAIAEFSLRGFKGATTQDIARRAGLTKPQLHYYIAGKDELYQELLRDVLNGWSAGFIFESDEHDAATVLREYIRKKLEYALDNPDVSRIFTREIMDGGPNLGDYWPHAVASIRHKVERIERWIAQGQIRPLDARMFLMHIWAMTQHYADYETQVRVMLGCAAPQPLAREPIVHELTELVLRGAGVAPK